MPLFNESYEKSQSKDHHRHASYGYSLQDCFRRGVPVTSIEFNPPPVSTLEKQNLAYWRNLDEPDEEDRKILKGLASKQKAMRRCRENEVFVSVTDSAAGILRMHNLDMLTLFGDADFCERRLGTSPLIMDPNSTIVHLTRNHHLPWIKQFLAQCRNLGYHQLLIITGDPLKEIRFKPVFADRALAMDDEEGARHRLKNSVELLKYIKAVSDDFFLGVGHNPFLKKTVSEKHLSAKVEAGCRYIITQPVAYYDECWAVMDDFAAFRQGLDVKVPVIIGVFNYSVPCGSKGFREEIWQKRYKFWKRLFGFVPDGVRHDYERGLNGIEILARSINEMKKKGYYHFDVMNAERNGVSILKSRQRMTHELDRLAGQFHGP